MGFGDEIMAAGHAMRAHRETGRKVAILDRQGRARSHPLWHGNPAIAQAGQGAGATIVNGAGCRPYLEYPWSKETGQRFTAWRARDHVAKLYLDDEERTFAEEATAALRPFVVLEPTLKSKANPNKDWGFACYQAVVDALPHLTFVQLGAPPPRVANGVRTVVTPTFRQACAVLARAAAYLGAEGAFHHAAAALDVPAVVLFNPAAPVETLGHPGQVNLGASDRPCGSWRPCAHCRKALAAVTPGEVARALTGVLGEDRFDRCLAVGTDVATDRVEIELGGSGGAEEAGCACGAADQTDTPLQREIQT